MENVVLLIVIFVAFWIWSDQKRYEIEELKEEIKSLKMELLDGDAIREDFNRLERKCEMCKEDIDNLKKLYLEIVDDALEPF